MMAVGQMKKKKEVKRIMKEVVNKVPCIFNRTLNFAFFFKIQFLNEEK